MAFGIKDRRSAHGGTPVFFIALRDIYIVGRVRIRS